MWTYVFKLRGKYLCMWLLGNYIKHCENVFQGSCTIFHLHPYHQFDDLIFIPLITCDIEDLSCIYLPLIFLFQWSDCLELLHIFKIRLLISYSVMSPLHILNVSPSSEIYKYFVTVCSLFFILLMSFTEKIFNFDKVQVINFFFHGLYFWCYI